MYRLKGWLRTPRSTQVLSTCTRSLGSLHHASVEVGLSTQRAACRLQGRVPCPRFLAFTALYADSMLTGGIVIDDHEVGCGGVGIYWEVLHCQPSSYLCRRCRVAGPLLSAPSWGALEFSRSCRASTGRSFYSRPLQLARMACPSLSVRASASILSGLRGPQGALQAE
jgi:hypothetical protein